MDNDEEEEEEEAEEMIIEDENELKSVNNNYANDNSVNMQKMN